MIHDNSSPHLTFTHFFPTVTRYTIWKIDSVPLGSSCQLPNKNKLTISGPNPSHFHIFSPWGHQLLWEIVVTSLASPKHCNQNCGSWYHFSWCLGFVKVDSILLKKVRQLVGCTTYDGTSTIELLFIGGLSRYFMHLLIVGSGTAFNLSTA